jgi:hypothetical protein
VPLVAVALATVPFRSASADGTSDLYKATVIVAGYDMRSRPKGFAQSLREVPVKVSGEPRLTWDPRVAELAAHADQHQRREFRRGVSRCDPRGHAGCLGPRRPDVTAPEL